MKVRNEVKIGVVSLIAFVLAYLGLNFLKGINIFTPENQYKVRLQNLNGTAIATPVMIAGYKVGSVQSIDFSYDAKEGYGANLTLGLDPKVQIPEGSTIKVKTNMLSGAELVIVAPKEGSQNFLKSGDQIAVAAGDDIMTKVSEEILPEVVKMLPEVMSLLKQLNTLVANPAIDSMMHNLSRSTALMGQAMAKLNEGMTTMPTLMGNVNTMTQSLTAVSQKMGQLPLDSLMSNLHATTENLRQMSAQLKGKDGTAGKLLNDPSLYNRLDSLATSAEALVRDLKENPKRYVHFSIFGRKS